jgi:hypothetical protein
MEMIGGCGIGIFNKQRTVILDLVVLPLEPTVSTVLTVTIQTLLLWLWLCCGRQSENNLVALLTTAAPHPTDEHSVLGSILGA